MAQEMGESREAWGKDVMKMAEDFASRMIKEDKPYYIVYACKQDQSNHKVFRQTIKAYFQRPPAMLGILVWFVNNGTGEFRFMPELSAPPDIPIDPGLLSDKASDASTRVMEQGEKLKALNS